MEEEIAKNRNLHSLGVLAGGIAHEFNNMLAGLVGGLSQLKESVKSDREAFEVAELAERSAMKYKHLTEKLITFSQGGYPVKESTDLSALLNETIDKALENSDVRGIFELLAKDSQIAVDGSQIARCFEHITQNAMEAMPNGRYMQNPDRNYRGFRR